MEDHLRKRILDNINDLVACTKYPNLLLGCVQNGLISDDMTQGIEDFIEVTKQARRADTERERHRRLFVKITKRGPDAYRILIRVLHNLQYEQALRILAINENDDNFKSISGKDQPQCPPAAPRSNEAVSHNAASLQANNYNNNRLPAQPYNGKISDQPESIPPLEIVTKFPDNPDFLAVKKAVYLRHGNDIYAMTSKANRGVLFLVNIIEFPDKTQRRNGAEKDSEYLLHVFKEFGFKIFSYENLTEKQFFALLQQLLESEHVRNTECFTLALMTHGERQTHMEYAQFHNGEMVRLSRILDAFHLEGCPNLKNKPKIFIFPFCRGDQVQPATGIETDSVSSGKSNFSDIIVCHATNIGFKSHRDPQKGSYYIQNLCANLAAHAWEKSLEDMLKKTHRDVSNDPKWTQNGSYESLSFNKSFYFNPGVYAE